MILALDDFPYKGSAFRGSGFRVKIEEVNGHFEKANRRISKEGIVALYHSNYFKSIEFLTSTFSIRYSIFCGSLFILFNPEP
jgi:hypothetical protein